MPGRTTEITNVMRMGFGVVVFEGTAAAFSSFSPSMPAALGDKETTCPIF